MIIAFTPVEAFPTSCRRCHQRGVVGDPLGHDCPDCSVLLLDRLLPVTEGAAKVIPFPRKVSVG